MPINECCNTDVVCCEAHATIPQVASLMRNHHVGTVVVIENRDGRRVPLGIVTDRDIVIETVALEVEAGAFTAGDLMSAPLAVVREDDGIVETLRTMRHHKVRRLPVVTGAGALFGIITADDVINLLSSELSMMTDLIAEQPGREARIRR